MLVLKHLVHTRCSSIVNSCECGQLCALHGGTNVNAQSWNHAFQKSMKVYKK